MNEVYVVTGTTGSYDDRTDWNVKAFEDEKGATDFISEIENVYKTYLQGNNFGVFRDPEDWTKLNEDMFKLDPRFIEIDTQTWYHIDVIELV
tara:strand:+ start:17938 stop:18213 length:276 start_codon:yes stop_codon:yes gene_type:complete